jgi:hypothetical protein
MRFPFLKCLWWVISRAFVLLSLAALLAGLNADIPGLGDHPLAQGVINFLSASLTWALHTLYDYPDAVFIGLISAAVLKYFFEYPHVEKLKAEVREARRLAKGSRKNGKSGKNRKKGRK